MLRLDPLEVFLWRSSGCQLSVRRGALADGRGHPLISPARPKFRKTLQFATGSLGFQSIRALPKNQTTTEVDFIIQEDCQNYLPEYTVILNGNKRK